MLAQMFDFTRPEHVQHDQAAAKLKAQLARRCQELQREIVHHPERAARLEAILEQKLSDLRKVS